MAVLHMHWPFGRGDYLLFWSFIKDRACILVCAQRQICYYRQGVIANIGSNDATHWEFTEVAGVYWSQYDDCQGLVQPATHITDYCPAIPQLQKDWACKILEIISHILSVCTNMLQARPPIPPTSLPLRHFHHLSTSLWRAVVYLDPCGLLLYKSSPAFCFLLTQ